MNRMTPAMLLKALKMFRGFTQAAGEYLKDKERLRYLLAAAVSIASKKQGHSTFPTANASFLYESSGGEQAMLGKHR